jgi:phosphatidylglycerophosphate synthase
LPILGRFAWVTPNNVTYAHIAIGIVAAGIVAVTRDPFWLPIAFVLLELRMILDCFDGVLARARGTSSPFGRALDELADTIATISLMIAITYRLSLGLPGFIVLCSTLAFGGLCANAWDFYKRKLTAALRDGKDTVLDELRSKKKVLESGERSFLAYWAVYFDCFQVLLYEVRPHSANGAPVGDAGDPVTMIRSEMRDPKIRRFAGLLSFLSFDNGLAILHLGVLTGWLYASEVIALGYAIVMWSTVMVSARVVLRGAQLQRASA